MTYNDKKGWSSTTTNIKIKSKYLCIQNLTPYYNRNNPNYNKNNNCDHKYN